MSVKSELPRQQTHMSGCHEEQQVSRTSFKLYWGKALAMLQAAASISPFVNEDNNVV